LHQTDFLVQLGIVVAAALVGGLIARALKAPVLVGYLVAGIVIGPSTPGFIADPQIVQRIANIGIVLLMFAVGVQFSLRELGAVKKTAILSGSVQVLGTTLLGLLVAFALNWTFVAGLFLGLALALSSTAVMMRVLEERGELGSTHGAIMLGILILQDLAVVVMISFLPAIVTLQQHGSGGISQVGIGLLRAFVSVALTLVLATRFFPRILRWVTRTGSAELLLLTVVTMVFGSAILAEQAGLGMAIGAFLAGVVISESPYAHEIFSQIRPLRDVFSSIFFVSIGMLLDPVLVVHEWHTVLAIVLAILIGKSLITVSAVQMAGWHYRTAFMVGLGLAQIGEFSLVLVNEASRRGIIEERIGSLVVAAALITLLLTPFVFGSAGGLYYGLARVALLRPLLHRGKIERLPTDERSSQPRVLILGGGRVGRYTSDALGAQGVPHLLIDYDAAAIERAREYGVPVLYGDATSPVVLDKARPERAELAVVALPEAATTEMAVKALRDMAPDLKIVARVRRGHDIPRMRGAGADAVVHGEFEAGVEMIRQAFGSLGVERPATDAYLHEVRNHRYRHEHH
jgi:monovalent cation:H+ antiporter-2, CPA2 family